MDAAPAPDGEPFGTVAAPTAAVYLTPIAPPLYMENSIIRRSLAVTMSFVIGLGLNYLLVITTNRLLSPAVFGLLYISISMINVIATPGPLLGMAFAQHVSVLGGASKPSLVVGEIWRVVRLSGRWVGIVLAALIAVLGLIGRQFGVESYAVIALIPAVACASIICEVIRSAFQGMQQFTWFSLTWVMWNGLNYIFVVVGLYIIGAVWAGLAGTLLSTFIIGSIALVRLSRFCGTRSSTTPEPETGMGITRVAILSPLVGYGLLNCLINADVLLAYLVLSHEQAGTYVASSVLPKAIVTMTLPVAQVLLPVIAAHADAGESARFSIVKAVAVVLVLAIAGVSVLLLASDFACGSRFGIRFCDVGVMAILAPTAIALSTLRVLVVISLASRNLWRPMLQALALIAFTILAELAGKDDPQRLAAMYFTVCSGFAVLYLAVEWLCERGSSVRARL